MKSENCTLTLSKDMTELKWSFNRQQALAPDQKAYGKCKIKDIDGIIYGGVSSTFYKYQNSILKMIAKGEEQPFYCWECVSLKC